MMDASKLIINDNCENAWKTSALNCQRSIGEHGCGREMQQRGCKSWPRGEGCCSSVPVALDLLVSGGEKHARACDDDGGWAADPNGEMRGSS